MGDPGSRAEPKPPKPPTATGSTPGAPVGLRPVCKAMLILEFVSSRVAAVGVADIARGTGLPRTTTYRLVSVLESHGALQRNGTRVHLGSMAHRMADAVGGRRVGRLNRLLMPYLVELHDRTHLPVSVATLSGRAVCHLETVHGLQHSELVARYVRRAPMHHTAFGMVLLAYARMPETWVDDASDRFDPLGSRVIEVELAGIRREGVAHDPVDHVPGARGLAAPVSGVGAGQPPLAIGVFGHRRGFDANDVAQALRRVAHAASNAIRMARIDRTTTGEPGAVELLRSAATAGRAGWRQQPEG